MVKQLNLDNAFIMHKETTPDSVSKIHGLALQ